MQRKVTMLQFEAAESIVRKTALIILLYVRIVTKHAYMPESAELYRQVTELEANRSTRYTASV